jgi:hypothetical protein
VKRAAEEEEAKANEAEEKEEREADEKAVETEVIDVLLRAVVGFVVR